MTDDQINDEIMRQLGWEFRCGGWRRGEDGYVNALDAHNFAGSLDAMHEAERVLFADIKNYEPYRQQLLRICLRPVHATARQRAEAFLRVKGAWVE